MLFIVGSDLGSTLSGMFYGIIGSFWALFPIQKQSWMGVEQIFGSKGRVSGFDLMLLVPCQQLYTWDVTNQELQTGVWAQLLLSTFVRESAKTSSTNICQAFSKAHIFDS